MPAFWDEESRFGLGERGEDCSPPLWSCPLGLAAYSLIRMVHTPVRYATSGHGSQDSIRGDTP